MYSGSLTQRLRHFTLVRIQHRLTRDVFEMSQEKERTVFENTFLGIMKERQFGLDVRYFILVEVLCS
ncbi:hypothetical protein [Coxiella-like endosymbiont]|uniref:hypothetical protein n=1 Tax=Coxiella-like endosymbiont TaxID=1592897 RepID=UPI002729F511|nr:hypothetical protein [Coxiella-like endosymbiont]